MACGVTARALWRGRDAPAWWLVLPLSRSGDWLLNEDQDR